MNKILACFCVALSGCWHTAYVVPDKFAVQVNIDPMDDDKHGGDNIDQIRFGLVWDIPQPD